MADIFISYKSDRRAAAEHMAEILADYGYTIWWDYALASGHDFGAQIERELRAAKAVVVMWCSLSRESQWVKEEAGLAKRLGTLLPVQIEAIELPLGFSMSQTVDLSGWDASPHGFPLQRLLREIERLTGKKPRPNQDGLMRTERAWQRYGAPTLVQFPLAGSLERNQPSRTMPSSLAATSGNVVEEPRCQQGRRIPAAPWLLGALAVLSAVGLGYWLRSDRPAAATNSASAVIASNTNTAEPALESVAAPASQAERATSQPGQQEKASYQQALSRKARAAYQQFLNRYPNSPFAADVRRRVGSCTSSTVRVRPGRRVASEANSREACRAALESQCSSGVIEDMTRDATVRRREGPIPGGPPVTSAYVVELCAATCYGTRRVERCD